MLCTNDHEFLCTLGADRWSRKVPAVGPGVSLGRGRAKGGYRSVASRCSSPSHLTALFPPTHTLIHTYSCSLTHSLTHSQLLPSLTACDSWCELLRVLRLLDRACGSPRSGSLLSFASRETNVSSVSSLIYSHPAFL